MRPPVRTLSPKRACTGVGARATSKLSAELNYNRNDVKMPWGDFLVNLSVEVSSIALIELSQEIGALYKSVGL